MKNKKSTKRALLLSALSLLLCMAMLVGSTFAWFTDSVTSGRNTIVSGQLDVNLYYATLKEDNTWTDYAEVDSDIKVFNENALYEPGYTEVVKFKVVNEGTLALKYSLDAKIYHETAGKNVYGDMFNLSNYLYTGTLAAADYTRAAAVAAATTQLSTGFNMKSTSVLNAGAEEELVLVLTMPTTVGNEANHVDGFQPAIDLGISLIATQATYEADDFDNLYDADATLPVNQAVTAPVSGGDTNIGFTAPDSKLSDFNAVVPEGALADGVTELVLTVQEQEKVNSNITVAANQTATTYEINIAGIDANNNEAILVTMNIGAGLTNVKLYHNDDLIPSSYNEATGELRFSTTGFSPFTVVCDSVDVTEVATAAELVAAIADGGNIMLTANITSSATIVINNSVNLDGNGFALNYTGVGSNARAINISGANGVTIKNLTINAAKAERAINVIQNATNIVIDNVTATSANYTVNIAASAPNAVVAITNSTLDGLCTVNVSAAEAAVTVDYSIINCNDNNTTEGEAYAALSLNKEAVGGSIIANSCTIYVADGSDSLVGKNGAEDGTVKINGSTDDVVVTVAAITYEGSPYYHSFASLESAFEFAKEGDTIILIRDITVTAPVVIPEGVTLNLNGHTITENF